MVEVSHVQVRLMYCVCLMRTAYILSLLRDVGSVVQCQHVQDGHGDDTEGHDDDESQNDSLHHPVADTALLWGQTLEPHRATGCLLYKTDAADE